MTRELSERTAADLALLVTEVVGNSVKHATRSIGDEIVIRLYVGDLIRVEGGDRGPGFDAADPTEPGSAAASGWGLYLLDTLSSSWDVETGNTTTVWFELDPSARR